MSRYIVTGAAGFIGYHTCRRLLLAGHDVTGVDNFNDYYSPALKRKRAELLIHDRFQMIEADVCQLATIGDDPVTVIHLAAQAGVRHSITHPEAYIQSNLVGFGHILELCRHGKVDQLIYASSSSVYGADSYGCLETDRCDRPLSLYAATKRANELMAHAYSSLYGLRTTGLRFFSVYGPWGRPDMAMWIFAKAILSGEPITLFNHGDMCRDFTYVDDIVSGILALAANPFPLPYRLYNIGGEHTIGLEYLVELLEAGLGRRAIIRRAPMQPGDVYATQANSSALAEATGQKPVVSVEDGVGRFCNWFRAVGHLF